MKKYLSFKQATLTAALAILLSTSSGIARANSPNLPPDSPSIVNIGPCQAYDRDGGDGPRVGSRVWLKCPPNSVYINQNGSWIPVTTNNTWFYLGIDSFYPAPTCPFTAPCPGPGALSEGAIGRPSAEYTEVLRDVTGQAIYSYKFYTCPRIGAGILQHARVNLGGVVRDSGGMICPL